MKDRLRVKGLVTVRVLDKDGNVKRRPPTRRDYFFGFLKNVFRAGPWYLFGKTPASAGPVPLLGRLLEQRFHNIVTREGDALIADALLASPAKTKVTSSSGYIQVGTGWTGTSTKTNTRCNTSTGSMKVLDSGYPALKAAWGNSGDTTITYRATFAAGSLNANGINEACLLNGNSGSADCLAYAQINPAVNVTSSDTLQILWEITILGQ
jgi:hypothetical protein